MKRNGLIKKCCVSVLASAIAWSDFTVAFASTYMDLDATQFVPGQNNGGDLAGKKTLGMVMIDIIQIILTNVLLPIGILMSVWRSVYYAVFCVLAHTDPFHLLNERNLSMVRSTTGTSAKARTQLRRQRALEQTSPAFGDFESVEPEIGIAALKDELRRTARSLIVVTCMWAFFQMIVYIVSFFLTRFD